ncbi:MAG: acetyl-CoA carboxylase biotin carboxyl carrier protein subunit [Alphaproteobacteria bacterium]|nr:acetyl-CoA carboxylase biotin carboxyl carrier protein subunit [Alphaproteobacteria bacterium]
MPIKKFRISVDGKPYNVVVEAIDDQGAPIAVAPVMAAPVAVAAPVAAPAPAPVAAAAGPAAGDQLSPLNGVLVRVDVAMGQQVNDGDPIATIEAMKMKTTAFAKGSGKVTRILVKAGDPLEQGQPLLTLG